MLTTFLILLVVGYTVPAQTNRVQVHTLSFKTPVPEQFLTLSEYQPENVTATGFDLPVTLTQPQYLKEVTMVVPDIQLSSENGVMSSSISEDGVIIAMVGIASNLYSNTKSWPFRIGKILTPLML